MQLVVLVRFCYVRSEKEKYRHNVRHVDLLKASFTPIANSITKSTQTGEWLEAWNTLLHALLHREACHSYIEDIVITVLIQSEE